MQGKVSDSLRQSFQFDPQVDRQPGLDQAGVILMKPLVVRISALPQKLSLAVAEERIKLSGSFSLKDGGKIIENVIGGFTVEAKPHVDLISTSIGAESPVARWTLLRKSW